MNRMIDAIRGDYEDAMASMTPKQAWALEIYGNAVRDLSQRCEHLKDYEVRSMLKDNTLAAFMAGLRDQALVKALESVRLLFRGAPAPKDEAGWLDEAKKATLKLYPTVQVIETFAVADVIYLKVRDGARYFNVKSVCGEIRPVGGL